MSPHFGQGGMQQPAQQQGNMGMMPRGANPQAQNRMSPFGGQAAATAQWNQRSNQAMMTGGGMVQVRQHHKAYRSWTIA